MPKTKNGKRNTVAITLLPELDTQMRILASIEGVSNSILCEKAIAQYLQIHQERVTDYFQHQFRPIQPD